ncbi:hypothetical protein ANO11243_088290 [Dothideomycetidae sp. 11243]|nr:hypothetical protein ANO11243_088290 [fungal sp. No.11243]
MFLSEIPGSFSRNSTTCEAFGGSEEDLWRWRLSRTCGAEKRGKLQTATREPRPLACDVGSAGGRNLLPAKNLCVRGLGGRILARAITAQRKLGGAAATAVASGNGVQKPHPWRMAQPQGSLKAKDNNGRALFSAAVACQCGPSFGCRPALQQLSAALVPEAGSDGSHGQSPPHALPGWQPHLTSPHHSPQLTLSHPPPNTKRPLPPHASIPAGCTVPRSSILPLAIRRLPPLPVLGAMATTSCARHAPNPPPGPMLAPNLARHPLSRCLSARA